jgi:hypothetical protein
MATPVKSSLKASMVSTILTSPSPVDFMPTLRAALFPCPFVRAVCLTSLSAFCFPQAIIIFSFWCP